MSVNPVSAEVYENRHRPATPGTPGRHRIRLIAATLVSALLVSVVGCERTAETPVVEKPRVGLMAEGAKRPNVIFILVDTLRADRVGAYGHPGRLTPTIDSIAAEGVTFDYCVSAAPWTLPSIGTLFTSYYPGVHKATSYTEVAGMEAGRAAVQSVLSDEFVTLAEALQAGGYQTAGFVAAKFLRDGYGFGQGFDHYDTAFADNTVIGEKVNRALFDWLQKDRDESKPLFLYLHYMDVHGPYDAALQFMEPRMRAMEAVEKKTMLTAQQFQMLNPYINKPPAGAADDSHFEKYKGYREYWVARYESGVAEADYYLAQLKLILTKMGIWDNAYVIVTADHGEALCEHGLWEHGYSQFQTDLHVPLVMRWPGTLPAGKRVRNLASLIDVMPTMLEQLRLPCPENVQGTSLVDHISDTLPEAPIVRFAESVKPTKMHQFALFVNQAKLILEPRRGGTLPDGSAAPATTLRRLYALNTDPQENFDISAQQPELLESMTREVANVVARNRKLQPQTLPDPKVVSPDVQQQLAAIGYVGGAEEEDDDEGESGTAPAASQPAMAPPASQPASGGGEPPAWL